MTTYGGVNSGPMLVQTQKHGGVKPVNGVARCNAAFQVLWISTGVKLMLFCHKYWYLYKNIQFWTFHMC